MYEGVGCGGQTLRGRSRRGRVTMEDGECIDDGCSVSTARRTVSIDGSPMFRWLCYVVVEGKTADRRPSGRDPLIL